MAEKSKSWFLTLKTEDPASNSGIISLYKVQYLRNEEKLINKKSEVLKSLIFFIRKSGWKSQKIKKISFLNLLNLLHNI